MSSDLIVAQRALGFPWETVDPFLFCVHHLDNYPAGDDRMAPAVSLAGRDLGQDFSQKDGFSLYHGQVVPGFPQHPHRGFETVTIVRRGLIDHSDSLGAAARFGAGDVQWLTAGRGIVHSEMFPLLERERGNPLELFQIWLNLPAEDKMVPPHFAMLWQGEIPVVEHADENGRRTTVQVVAGELEGRPAPAPPPKSWAARKETDVAIFSIQMAPGARYTLPPAKSAAAVRTLYFFAGNSLQVGAAQFSTHAGLTVRSELPLPLVAGSEGTDILVLQGRPIGEPVAQYGPFVMNTRLEIQQAFAEYRDTQFGGWPWPSDDPVHGRAQRRFARHADGKLEER